MLKLYDQNKNGDPMGSHKCGYELLNATGAILFINFWKQIRGFLLISRGGTLSTYPDVIVTIAHQAPSQTPCQKDEGNWRWFALWSWLWIKYNK